MSFLRLVNGGRLTSESGRLDDLTSRMLSQLGFLGIARKIVSLQELEREEMLQMFNSASLPILMKLVSLLPNRPDLRIPRSALVLPWSYFLSNHDFEEASEMSQNLIRNIPHQELECAFDFFDIGELYGNFGKSLIAISKARSGVCLVGPRPEDIMSWIARHKSPKTEEQCVEELRSILLRLKEIGIGRLRLSEFKLGVKIAGEVGLRTSLATDLSSFSSYTELVDEIESIRELSHQVGIEIWAAFSRRANNAVAYFNAIRLMAIGRLVFERIEHVRAPSSFFPEECLRFAFYCGATDFGSGAIDLPTQQRLNVKGIAKIRHSIELLQALRT